MSAIEDAKRLIAADPPVLVDGPTWRRIVAGLLAMIDCQTTDSLGAPAVRCPECGARFKNAAAQVPDQRLAAGESAPVAAAPRVPFHRTNPDCAWDRNASHSVGNYVCTCGWEDRAV